jgi:cytidylate kinase
MLQEIQLYSKEQTMSKNISVAIDGPSGAGKSTISRTAAKTFGLLYVDTGAIYRTVGLAAQKYSINSKDAEGIEWMLPNLAIDFSYDKESGEQLMFLNGENVSKEIRTPQSSLYASDVSAMPAVRAFLLEMQREMARRYNVIMDGRDIGTVVLPDAGLKIFLTASPEDRARRRYAELKERGIMTTFEEVLQDIQYRDQQDSARAAAPLRPADDAVIFDTTGNSFEQSAELICQTIRERFSL